jgi:L-threonylcarbamoyladenylate synthase
VSDPVERAVTALLAGELVVLPTDTVYGLAATAYREEPARRLYRLKGRDEIQPTALMASGVDLLLDCVPELRGRPERIVRALLPGPLTLVLPNPARRFHWLNGPRQDAIGVRVPALTGPGAAVLQGAGAIVATSANLAGGPDPCTPGEIPQAVRDGVAVVVEGGTLPGVPSTVIDFTAAVPVVLRCGAADVDEVLARVDAEIG